jgi:MFS family permease
MDSSVQNGVSAAPVTVAADEGLAWWQGITRYQWIVLAMTSLGLMFDLMDAGLLGLAMSPALRDLLGARASTENVGWYGGVITTIFLVGWSLGGILFGVFADYYGRKNALMVTILLYSVFTGLSVFSHTWWQFAFFRFVTALGIGGEWSAGTALLAETWPERSRVKGAILLQSSSSTGGLVASVINIIFGAFGWRYIFLVGAFPGFMLLGLRYWVKESDRWLDARANADGKPIAGGDAASASDLSRAPKILKPHSQTGGFTLKEIFSRKLIRDTIVGTTLATIVTFGFWAIGWFVPTMVSEMLSQGAQKIPTAAVVRAVSNSRILITFGSLTTYVVFLFAGTGWRRKTVLNLFFIGAFISTMMFLYIPHSLHSMLLFLPLMAFFVPGVWVIFPVYLPELYPTRLRGTGAGFCFTFGRALSAAGPVLTGFLVKYTGSFVTAMAVPAFIYLLGPLILLFARETRGQTLQ